MKQYHLCSENSFIKRSINKFKNIGIKCSRYLREIWHIAKKCTMNTFKFTWSERSRSCGTWRSAFHRSVDRRISWPADHTLIPRYNRAPVVRPHPLSCSRLQRRDDEHLHTAACRFRNNIDCTALCVLDEVGVYSHQRTKRWSTR